MTAKEATARIKINRALESSGWRFFDEADGKANIVLEPKVKLTHAAVNALGEDFEHAANGFVDFLLLDETGRPLAVLEAKAESKEPLTGKEQARKYARSQNCRFVILSNGNLHYFWDLERGNPHIVTSLPRPGSMLAAEKLKPDPARIVAEPVEHDYIALTQRPGYASEAGWTNEAERSGFIAANRLKFMRDYQVRAVRSLQKSVEQGNDRFLLEMATGTGKTLTAAAVIKLFLRTRNANRVLFLVDRLELEDQAKKAFQAVLANDAKTVVFKENRDDWHHAEIVVSTVQSFLFNNKYASLFSPTDFDLVISDEAHRSIGGNARAVFEYFTGYKLGLTATPRDYLKKFDAASANDPREHERRLLLDTYRTFGCEDGTPTFRYSLLDGVKDGFLINPTVVDARTDTTTRLLSDEGFVASFTDGEGESQEESFGQRQFEKRFFSPETNRLFCKTFLENALPDPISGETGKSIIFAVSQHHAGKLAQVLNEMADVLWPGRYQSDFAAQVTSHIPDAQQMTINFANNRLLGTGNVLPDYKTGKARVCVTVGMMTTGYDCPDILNLGLFRPIFSATDFIQIKGRGTRRHEFTDDLHDPKLKADIGPQPKTQFKLFDFFANCVAVVSLPAGVFNPYSGVKTSILILDRAGAKASDTIGFFKVANDGFGLGAQRREVSGGEMTEVLAEIAAYRAQAAEVAWEGRLGRAVAKAEIAASGDYNLSGERYGGAGDSASSWPIIPFGDAFDKVGDTIEPRSLPGLVNYVGLENISQGTGNLVGDVLVADPSEIKSLKNVFRAGDILYGKLRPNLNKVWLADRDGICSTDIFVLRPRDGGALAPLFSFLIRSQRFNETVVRQLQGAQLPRVSWLSFERLEIPLPPLEVQREIVAEIEGYQKVIDGARAVVENYRPHIAIDPAWPMVALGELCTLIQYGLSTPLRHGAAFKTFRMGELVEGRCIDGGAMKGASIDEKEFGKYRLNRGDILFNRTNSFEHVGRTGIFDLAGEYCFASYLIRLSVDSAKADPFFINAFMNTENFQQGVKQFASRAIGQANINAKSLAAYHVPCPPLATQREIVAELEAERALVEANRDLIARMETRIEAAIARVWGAVAPEAAEAPRQAAEQPARRANGRR